MPPIEALCIKAETRAAMLLAVLFLFLIPVKANAGTSSVSSYMENKRGKVQDVAFFSNPVRQVPELWVAGFDEIKGGNRRFKRNLSQRSSSACPSLHVVIVTLKM